MDTARLSRRTICGMALAGCATAAQGRSPVSGSRAELRLLVGFPPGGASDLVARLHAEQWRLLGSTPVVVENKPGAGGRLAVEALSAAPPDGATLLLTPASMLTIAPHAYPRSTRYDPLRDLTPVAPLCAFPFVLAVPATHPARSLEAFREWAVERGTVPFASPAAGSMPHLLGLRLAQAWGVHLEHVSYRGGAPALQDLMGGNVASAVLVLGDVLPAHLAGSVRILAHTAPGRLPRLPEVPSFAEMGLPALTAQEWFGLFLPAGAAPETVSFFHRMVAGAQVAPAVVGGLDRLDFQPLMLSSDAFAARLAAEHAAWGQIVERMELSLE